MLTFAAHDRYEDHTDSGICLYDRNAGMRLRRQTAGEVVCLRTDER